MKEGTIKTPKVSPAVHSAAVHLADAAIAGRYDYREQADDSIRERLAQWRPNGPTINVRAVKDEAARIFEDRVALKTSTDEWIAQLSGDDPR